jgi:hypothetical protein
VGRNHYDAITLATVPVDLGACQVFENLPNSVAGQTIPTREIRSTNAADFGVFDG